MALASTIHVFTVRLADADRNLYETLNLRLAQHPSESAEYFVTRLLAFCLEYREGIAFSAGLSSVDEPAIMIRDLTGARQAWIEVGLPEGARLHKAAKAVPRVAVYPHRDPDPWLVRLSSERIHRSDAIRIQAIDRELISALAERLERRMEFDLSVAENTLYLTLGEETLTGAVESMRL